jgi:adenylate kinase family enzyme
MIQFPNMNKTTTMKLGSPSIRMRRIVVIGTSGSGKTTLARQLSQRLGIPHIELDALYWEKNWTATSHIVFQERTEQALSGDAWVVDGNYSSVRNVIWTRADTIVWLDYSLWTIMRQLLGRTFRRILTQEELWNGNREPIRTIFFSKDSILLWALQTYRRWRREYLALFSKPEYAHLQVVRLRSPHATRDWLASLPESHT